MSTRSGHQFDVRSWSILPRSTERIDRDYIIETRRVVATIAVET